MFLQIHQTPATSTKASNYFGSQITFAWPEAVHFELSVLLRSDVSFSSSCYLQNLTLTLHKAAA